MKKKNKRVNAAILIIGNEILSGRTQDKNISFISNWLNLRCGISVNEVRIVPDIEKTIIDTLNFLRKSYNYVFTSGGIGPTHDDITAQAVAKAFDLKYEIHKEAFKIQNVSLYFVSVPTMCEIILYGSALEAGLLSSKYPFQSFSTV